MGGSTILEHWLTAVQNCALINFDKLYVVCSPTEQAEIQVCLAKHQQQQQALFSSQICLVTAQLGSSAAPNHTAGLRALAAAHPLPELLIVLDGAGLCEPGFSLQRFVQHTLTRNADMISFSPALPPSAISSSAAWVQLQDSSINPRAVDIVQQYNPAAYTIGPVYGLYQQTLTAVSQQGATRLQDAMQMLLHSSAVYASPVQCSLDVSNLEGYLYADAFYTFCEQQWALLHGPLLSDSAASLPAAQTQALQQQVQQQVCFSRIKQHQQCKATHLVTVFKQATNFSYQHTCICGRDCRHFV